MDNLGEKDRKTDGNNSPSDHKISAKAKTQGQFLYGACAKAATGGQREVPLLALI